MARKKKTKYDLLRETVVQDMEERGAYSPVDDHLVDQYIAQVKLVDALQQEVEDNVLTKGARGEEAVANPALVRLPAAQRQLLALAKQLGIGPYGRKLTTGEQSKTNKQAPTVVSQLRPRSRNKAN